jgi:peroxiredoxin family protein
MITTTRPAFDPLTAAIAEAEGLDAPVPAAFTDAFASPEASQSRKTRDLVIVCYSGDLERTWASLILATTAAASGVPTKVFITFWGLLPFVKDQRRIVGENWMQKMLTLMQRPGISHLKLSKMNFMGMGPWMIGQLSKKYNIAKPAELLEAAQAMEVEFIP